MESSEEEAPPPTGVAATAPLESGTSGQGPVPADGAYRLVLGLPGRPGWRGELLILLGLALAACILTWPMVVTLGEATGTRPDYYNNLWNAWWVKHSISGAHLPFWTDYLYYPEGISLGRHTLSPLNSLSIAGLTTMLSGHAAFSLVILAHFVLSAWCFSLLARYVTGSLWGGILGGLVYSYCPFHYFYLCQVNVFSFEFLPLSLLFLMKHMREGGRANLVGVLGALLGMALTVEYYVVYAYLAFGVLLLCGTGWARGLSRKLAARRALLACGLGALVVVLAALPLLWAALTSDVTTPEPLAKAGFQKKRYNDLFGFFWIGGDEECTVSWPTMLGYSTLALILVGWRRVLRHWPWVVMGFVFMVLSLGNELAIGRDKTGIPMPYAIFAKLPVLSMLRKSDRAFMMVQLATCVSLAAAWAGIAAWLRSRRVRGGLWGSRLAGSGLWCGAVLLTMTELTGVPFQRFQVETSPGFAALREDPEVASVMELPPMITHTMNGRYVFFQTLHGKKSTLGYTTSLALEESHRQRLQTLINLYFQFTYEQNRVLPRFASKLGVERVIHYKHFYVQRPMKPSIEGKTLWQPFFFLRRPLVFVRQVGEYALEPFPEDTWRHIRQLLSRSLGDPLFEDDFMAIFPVPRRQ